MARLATASAASDVGCGAGCVAAGAAWADMQAAMASVAAAWWIRLADIMAPRVE
jgi:hypothetical protein